MERHAVSNHVHQTSSDIRQAIAKGDSFSYWLKDAVESLAKRDVCNADSDAKILARFADMRCRETLGLRSQVVELSDKRHILHLVAAGELSIDEAAEALRYV